ncbi:MAG TPA: DNA alkylation repair protein [Ilumatobacteraceae bacterium]|nr:DNA alkylation repair protein [Ilumatobacteraceae bacterium]HRB05277.1 DNA alkylation repair protein [Ilumatobacteraceae bacterium]
MVARASVTAAAEAAVLLAQLTVAGSSARAISEKAYLKSELQFVGSGVPATRAIVKAWLQRHPDLDHDDLFAVADALWAHPVHECRQSAVELLVMRPRLITLLDVPWLYNTLRDSHTWALVDPLAGSTVADLAARDPQGLMPHLDRWVHDADFWIRRSAVLSLRTLLRHDRELDRFFSYATLLLPETEFFIRKVLGWVLREVAARRPEMVSSWLRDHMAQMNLVTLREPLRRLADADELRALYDARQVTRRNNAG